MLLLLFTAYFQLLFLILPQVIRISTLKVIRAVNKNRITKLRSLNRILMRQAAKNKEKLKKDRPHTQVSIFRHEKNEKKLPPH